MVVRIRYTWTGLGLLVGLLGCGDDDGGGNGGGRDEDESAVDASLCEQICTRASAAKCENDDADDCASECVGAMEATPASCASKLTAFERCAARARWSCDDENEAEPIGCDEELVAWVTCVDPQEGPSTPGDTGDDDDNDGPTGEIEGDLLCKPAADDDACGTCVKGSCCDELTACGPACQKIFACIAECATEACQKGCEQQNPAGAVQYDNIMQCTSDSCTTACANEGGTVDITPGDETSGGVTLPADCLPKGSVPTDLGLCDLQRTPNAYECKKAPFSGCVKEPTGVSDIWCCAQ